MPGLAPPPGVARDSCQRGLSFRTPGISANSSVHLQARSSARRSRQLHAPPGALRRSALEVCTQDAGKKCRPHLWSACSPNWGVPQFLPRPTGERRGAGLLIRRDAWRQRPLGPAPLEQKALRRQRPSPERDPGRTGASACRLGARCRPGGPGGCCSGEAPW